MLLFVVAVLVQAFICGESSPLVITAQTQSSFEEVIPCRLSEVEYVGCAAAQCKRRVFDGLFSEKDIVLLTDIAKKGMNIRENIGGPTILDINTGFIRDSIGLDNLFTKANEVYDANDFGHYNKIINQLREAVIASFGIEKLFFTAPTFFTRIDATHDWKAREAHDEYWHIHADRNNTEHYFYSGLLYLSSYGQDFTGGMYYSQLFVIASLLVHRKTFVLQRERK